MTFDHVFLIKQLKKTRQFYSNNIPFVNQWKTMSSHVELLSSLPIMHNYTQDWLFSHIHADITQRVFEQSTELLKQPAAWHKASTAHQQQNASVTLYRQYMHLAGH